MKKNLNRIATLALSAMLVGGMAMPVFAADFSFNKTIDMSGAEKADVPNVTFTYTLANGAGGQRDVEGGGKVEVFPGVEGGVSFTTNAAFTDATAIGVGSLASIPVEFTVNMEKFTKAGIYEYTLTETANTTIDGMENAANGKTITLYVTIVNDGEGRKLSGLLLAEGENKKGDEIFKSTYKTHSLEIKKVVDGTLGDKTMEFDFTDAITAAENNTEKYYIVGESGEKAVAPDRFKLAHGKSITIYGLSANDSARITETVGAELGYTTKGETTGAEGSFTAETAGGGAATVSKFTEGENAVLTITNTRDAVTPTGIVMDIAPYVLMLGAAGGLGAAFMVKRRDDEE